MPDLQHTFGADLSLSATGSLAVSSGTQLGQERVMRRLLTNPGAYIWHLEYGAGLGRFVGQPVNAPLIRAVVLAQMYLESVVSRDPHPQIDVVSDQIGNVTLSIIYQDADTSEPVTISYPLV